MTFKNETYRNWRHISQCFQWYSTSYQTQSKHLPNFPPTKYKYLDSLWRSLTDCKRQRSHLDEVFVLPAAAQLAEPSEARRSGHKLNACTSLSANTFEKCMENTGDNLKRETWERVTQHAGWLGSLGWWVHNIVQSVAFARFHLCNDTHSESFCVSRLREDLQ